MKTAPLRVALALLTLSLLATAAPADPTKLDPLARRALSQVRAGVATERIARARLSVNAARELDVFIVGDASRDELEAAGARIRTALPGVSTAYVPVDAVERVSAIAGVRSIRGAARMKSTLNASTPTTNVQHLRGAAPSFTGLNGSGVLVGDVDSGADYDHGDFKNANGTTRFVRIWDQGDLGGPAPAGFGYGSEWTPAAIDAHAARQIDADGHGTHVLGIAGGDGSATGGSVPAFTYVGMAPRADLVMVKTNFTDTGIVDGVAYIMALATARGQNAVVNLSLGGLFGPKDGTSPMEAAIDALTGPGRIVVVSAGNEGGLPEHAEVVTPAGGSVSSTLQVNDTGIGAVIGLDGYYAAAGSPRLTVVTPSGTVIGPIATGGINEDYPGTPTPDGDVYVENGAFVTATGDREVYVEMNVLDFGEDLTGTWTFTFTNGSSASHDETSENLTGAGWNSASGSAATPGSVAGGFSGSHLLITEVGWRGLNVGLQADSTEFIEIHNPTASTIALSNYYLSDVNLYRQLPVAGTINLSAINTDFAMRFPAGSSIGPGQTRVIAIDGGRYRRGTGVNADFMFFNAGGATTALPMIDVATNKGSGYPGFGALTNSAELVWLFSWDQASDLVCDGDLVYWGFGSGGNLPSRKTAADCQDGPDAGSGTSCYSTDAGNPSGSLGRPLSVPANGAGTRQRTGAEGVELGPGNGCAIAGGGVEGDPVEVDQWLFYSDVDAGFVLGNQPDQELVAEPGNAAGVITVGAWVTKNTWTDCGGRAVTYTSPPAIGSLADFSSPGPTRDGREKPDLVAPGMGVGSATTFDVGVACPGVPSGLLDDGMQHQIFEGTSMAAPHVTGAVALLLQKYGALTPAQVKTILHGRAITDGFTGAAWNRFAGHGKLFLGDLTDPTAHVEAPNGGENLTLATPVSLQWTASDPYLGVTAVDLELSRDGGSSFEPIALGVPNTGSYEWTVTGPVTSQARLRVTPRDAAGNSAQDLSDAAFTISAPTGVAGAPAITRFELAVRSGNPAPGAVRIEFAVPRESDLSVTVYDLLGRAVASLARGRHAPGRYEASWSPGGAGIPSGIYFVRLRTAGHEIVQRIALAR